jgi:hypothetical protein
MKMKSNAIFWLFLIVISINYSCNSKHLVPENAQAAFYVSPQGGDNNPGTFKKPFKSIVRARDEVRKINTDLKGDVYVFLRGGTYFIPETIEFNEEDSGSNGFNIIYKAYNNEEPVLSGGRKVEGWERKSGNIYKANLKRDTKLRSLYINGKRASMAHAESEIEGQGGWGTFEIRGDEPWAVDAGVEIEGIKFNPEDLGIYANPEDIELVQDNVWNEKILCIKDLTSIEGYTVVKIQQPFGAMATTMAWATLKPDNPFQVRNAYELLDFPGEFYFNKSTDTLYYFSDGEEMASAEVIVPSTITLIKLTGSSINSRVQNIRFYGITFSYDDWLLQSIGNSNGFVGIQSLGLTRYYIADGNWHPGHYDSCELPSGTVELANCESIWFERNRFEHLGSAIALNLANDVVNSTIIGNYFNDMFGTSVNIGHPHHYKIGDGPFFPNGVEGVCKNILVSNNYIRNACIDFRQLEGMCGFFVENVQIVHNDISGTPYGGIALGWWWGNSGIPPSSVARNNIISYNKVGNTHSALRDGGIIYVLGEQPNSVISYNYLYNGPRQVYPDDGSAYWKVENNVFENISENNKAFLWMHLWTSRCHDFSFNNNYVRKDTVKNNGNNIMVENTHVEPAYPHWSAEAQAIIDNSGLEEAYQDIVR